MKLRNAAGLLAASVALALASSPLAASASSPGRTVLGVVGDMPYGSAKVSAFPGFVSFVNTDTSLDEVVHLGDIKSGSSSPCTNDYFALIRSDFDQFQRPLIYTPGDNEWTDCHQDIKNNGFYMPTERLQKVRADFFPVAGQSLGVEKKQVLSEVTFPENSAYLENVMWTDANVVFATVNVPGSNDDLDPWGTDLPADAADYPSQSEERKTRNAATMAWLEFAFAQATKSDAAGIVLMMQADMWDITGNLFGYDDLVKHIGNFARDFGKPVLILEGDSHIFRVDHPYTPGDPLFSVHAKTPTAANVTRLVVEGSNTVKTRFEYVRLTVDPSAAYLFSWERVDYTF
jgi:hypothetical protein